MNSIFWRILLFYIFSIIVIAAIINFKDPRLLNPSSTAVMSPFTIVFKNIGFAVAASVMNAVILTSVISSANSVMYASTRILYSLGQERERQNSLVARLKMEFLLCASSNDNHLFHCFLNGNIWNANLSFLD